MALQNIGASNQDDAFYRYKMPKLITKIEGRGNGIKTNLANMVDVAKALARPPAYTTKYFGCELGAQSKFDEKTGTAIVNGAHDTAKLAGLLENFIKKYVQCYGCRNPETEIIITKNQLITMKCAACGFLSNVDMRDKLTTFILKNPPEQKKSGKKGMRRAEKERLKEGEAADEVKKGKKTTKKKGQEENGHVIKKKAAPASDGEKHSSGDNHQDETEEESDDDDVQWQTDTSATAAQQRIQEQLTAATSEMVMINTIPSNPDVAKPNSGKTKKVDLELEAKMKDSILKQDGLSSNKEDLHKKLVQEFRKSLASDFDSNLMSARLHACDPKSKQETMNAYFGALFFGTSKGLAREIEKKKNYLSQVVNDQQDQELLLGAVEGYYSTQSLEVRKEVPLVLKVLYDLDIIEEEMIVHWYDNGSGDGQIKKHAKLFVEWLQNAESEESSSE